MSRFSSLKSAVRERNELPQSQNAVEQGTAPVGTAADELRSHTEPDPTPAPVAKTRPEPAASYGERSAPVEPIREAKIGGMARDGFTIPAEELAVVERLRNTYFAERGKIATRSLIMRAALKALASMPSQAAADVLDSLPVPTRGRRRK
jgi:hypothetical protein